MSLGTSNAYELTVRDIDAPKKVFMAIAVSFALRIVGGNIDAARQLVMDEWLALHENGIVPQRPRKG
jgi:hypothetical protein